MFASSLNPDIKDSMHAFEVVCRTAFRLGWKKESGHRPTILSAIKVAASEFGLTRPRAQVCIARAESFLRSVNEADKKRKKKSNGRKKS